jgi:hypothetical protein
MGTETLFEPVVQDETVDLVLDSLCALCGFISVKDVSKRYPKAQSVVRVCVVTSDIPFEESFEGAIWVHISVTRALLGESLSVLSELFTVWVGEHVRFQIEELQNGN